MTSTTRRAKTKLLRPARMLSHQVAVRRTPRPQCGRGGEGAGLSRLDRSSASWSFCSAVWPVPKLIWERPFRMGLLTLGAENTRLSSTTATARLLSAGGLGHLSPDASAFAVHGHVANHVSDLVIADAGVDDALAVQLGLASTALVLDGVENCTPSSSLAPTTRRSVPRA